jgi:hypothetical protein
MLIICYKYINRCLLCVQEEFEDTKGVNIIRISKNRQNNDQRKKDKQLSTKHTHRTKDRVTRTPPIVFEVNGKLVTINV